MHIAAEFLKIWFNAVYPCFGLTDITEIVETPVVTFEVIDDGDPEIGGTVKLGLELTFNMPQPGIDCLSANLAAMGW